MKIITRKFVPKEWGIGFGMDRYIADCNRIGVRIHCTFFKWFISINFEPRKIRA